MSKEIHSKIEEYLRSEGFYEPLMAIRKWRREETAEGNLHYPSWIVEQHYKPYFSVSVTAAPRGSYLTLNKIACRDSVPVGAPTGKNHENYEWWLPQDEAAAAIAMHKGFAERGFNSQLRFFTVVIVDGKQRYI